MLLKTPKPPYYVVISTNIHHGRDLAAYEALWQETLKAAQQCKGFLGVETADEVLPDGRIKSIAAIYYDSLEAIEQWRHDAKHITAKTGAKQKWFDAHNIRVCEVLDQYGDGL